MTSFDAPSVRIVLGFVGSAKRPPSTLTSDATAALRVGVSRLGKPWQSVAPMFVVAPGAGSNRVVVGVSICHAPLRFAHPQQVGATPAIATTHDIVSAEFDAPAVDSHTRADEGILGALSLMKDDPRLRQMGLELEDTFDAPTCFLVSDDGRTGKLVHGRLDTSREDVTANEDLETFVRDCIDGRRLRLVGVPFYEVSRDKPVVDVGRGGFDLERDTQQRFTLLTMKRAIPTVNQWDCHWRLVSETSAPQPAVRKGVTTAA